MVAKLLDWFVGIWASAVDEGGLHPQVMGSTLVLLQFLLVCSGSGVFPLYLADKYWPSYCSPIGVQYDVGLAERMQHRFLLYMLCARIYLRLMWMDAT